MRTAAFHRRVPVAVAAVVLLVCGAATAAAAGPETVGAAATGAGTAGARTHGSAAVPSTAGRAVAVRPDATVDPDATGTALRAGTGLYPRVVRLAHSGSADGQLVASVVDFDAAGGVGAIYRSTDDGATFSQVGAIHDPATANGLCCSTLFELPRQIGAMPPGTLLWAASVGQTPADRRMAIDLWQSQDHGSTWSQLPPCQTAPNTGGLWEPELSVDAEGDLVCHYSDETDPARHSQSLEERFSSDGLTWGPVQPTVAPSDAALRPGMATVVQRADGSYYMTYEVCGTGDQYDCAAHYRTSADGADWGSPTDIGPVITTATGQFFTHAPTVAWLDNGTAAGRLVLVGQQFREANGAISTTSGRTVLVNTENGGGNWFPVDAPVAVPSPPDDYCPNYSSALLPSTDGARLLEIATDYNGSVCEPYYATGSAQGTGDSTGARAHLRRHLPGDQRHQRHLPRRLRRLTGARWQHPAVDVQPTRPAELPVHQDRGRRPQCDRAGLGAVRLGGRRLDRPGRQRRPGDLRRRRVPALAGAQPGRRLLDVPQHRQRPVPRRGRRLLRAGRQRPAVDLQQARPPDLEARTALTALGRGRRKTGCGAPPALTGCPGEP